jgi:N-acyl-L-homoserine lactone synthetase
MVRISVEQKLTHWCAVMEPTLLRMLDAMGIHFTRIGGLVQ